MNRRRLLAIAALPVSSSTEWSLTGRAESGALAGATLKPLPIRTTFWFSYATAFPDAEVYEP